MKTVEWSDAHLIGIPAIDLQHRGIFECAMRVMRGPAADDRLYAESELIILLVLLHEHFALEESMMRTLCYPRLEMHIEEHRQFHADVHDLAQKSLRRKAGVSLEAIKLVHKWFAEHIDTSDKHYAAFFANPARIVGTVKQAAK